jgi:hypothetical protein
MRVGHCGSPSCEKSRYARYAKNMQYMGGCILNIYCIYCIFAIYMQNMHYILQILHIYLILLQCVHLCIFERLNRNLVAACLLSDSDSDDEPIHPALDDDDQAPGDDSQARAGPGHGGLPPPCPLEQADTRKTIHELRRICTHHFADKNICQQNMQLTCNNMHEICNKYA